MIDQETLGCIEIVDIPALGVSSIIAKVDTGAFSGALHCSAIKLSDDHKTLSFHPLGKKSLYTQTTNFTKRQVRSASGHRQVRYTVPVELEIRGQRYATTIGLSNRSTMGYEMLIGRRFLREHNMLVDVTINSEYDEEWKQVNL